MRELATKYPDLSIIAYPSQEFGGQEYKDNAKILKFAAERRRIWLPREPAMQRSLGC